MQHPQIIWQHGTGALVEDPGQTLLFRHTGHALRVVGVAGSTNWLQYPITAGMASGPALSRYTRVLLRYRCDSPTALITNLAVYDGETVAFRKAGLNLCAPEWAEYSLALGDGFSIQHGLNISLGIRFDGADEDTHALEISSVGIEMHYSNPF